MNQLFTSSFLKSLRQKLTTGNARAIHLNALPGRSALRLDLNALSIMAPDLPMQFISNLLTEANFNFPITFEAVKFNRLPPDEQKLTGALSARLDNLFYENHDNFLEFGIETFGFGFPLLLRRDSQSNTVIAAPLLIWSLDIEKSRSTANKWTLKRSDDFGIELNTMLIAHLQKDAGITLPDINELLIEDGLIDRSEMAQICADAMKRLGESTPGEFQSVLPCPKNKEELSAASSAGARIQWSGVFGLYRSQKESIIADMDRLITASEEPVILPAKTNRKVESAASVIETDPSQAGILNELRTAENIIIQGPPGCGKSQSLTALITNALVEGKKCLVICEKKTALDVIYNNLESVGLAELCAVIDDVSKDRQVIVKQLRERAEKLPRAPQPLPGAFASQLKEVHRLRNAVNAAHAELSRPLLGTKNWSQVAALYLSSRYVNDGSTLAGVLTPGDFTFDHEEFFAFENLMAGAAGKLKPLKSLSNPLFSLNESVFQSNLPAAPLREELTRMIASLNRQAEELHSSVLKYKSEFETMFDSVYQALYESLSDSLAALKEKLRANLEASSLFNNPSFFASLRLAVLSVFSKKYSEIRNDRTFLKDRCSEGARSLEGYQLFPFDQPSPEEMGDYNKLLQYIQALLNSVITWKQTYSEFRTRASALSDSYSSPQQNDFSELINRFRSDASSRFEAVCSELIAPVAVNVSLASHFLAYTEALVQGLKNITKELELLGDLLEYRSFSQSLPEREAGIISKVLKADPLHAVESFRTRYLFLFLSHHSAGKPRSDSDIADLRNREAALAKAQVEMIRAKWQNEQIESMKLFSTMNIPLQTLYNLRGANGNRRNSLRKIIASEPDLFTDFFPVLLTNPVACSSVIPLSREGFDFVIFDEASQLRIEDTFPALLRGKYKIISGDRNQMPPSGYFASKITVEGVSEEDDSEGLFTTADAQNELTESDSLLQYAESSGFEPSFLDFHYRSRHPALIDFSNAAFYGSRLVPMPAKKNSTDEQIPKPIRFIEVNGLYETNKGVNLEEAKRVVELLIDLIPEVKSKLINSIGIGTLNLMQRNLVLDMLQAKMFENAELGEMVQRLTASKSFFVKNLENIQGDEKDIIIISTTFGINQKGGFLQNFGPLNQAKGYKLLNVIITRAKHRLYVCTSIPASAYMKYAEEISANGNVGKGIFYSYIAYAKAVEDGNEALRTGILELLKSKCIEEGSSYHAVGDSTFEDEVIRLLKKRYPEERIKKHYKVGGFIIDIVILPAAPDQKPIAIECDGADYHNSEEAWAWDLYRQKQLEQNGFIFKRIWSAKVWENPELLTMSV